MENDIKLGLKEVNDVRKEVYYTVLVVNPTTYKFMLLDIFEFKCAGSLIYICICNFLLKFISHSGYAYSNPNLLQLAKMINQVDF